MACLERLLKPGQTFIDCGANIGLFSVIASATMGGRGRVVSIEANPGTIERLRANLRANGIDDLIACAVTDREGEMELYLSGDGDVYSSLSTGGLVHPNSRSTLVTARTLDSIVAERRLERVDAIKIDVEGGEMGVLRSASASIDRFRPWCIVEYSSLTWPAFNASPEDLVAWCESRRYAIRTFSAERRAVVSLPDDAWSQSYLNVLLLPEELLTAFPTGSDSA
ncbi:MAG: FkbM family methyltransferase [Planctomycetota bacterium]|nr:FkbM family methyltransferase [Planctomycetaceae bacterium]MDQ3332931.1 FkbM family methyltransferase [Planctomycetota bacterium]